MSTSQIGILLIGLSLIAMAIVVEFRKPLDRIAAALEKRNGGEK